MIRGKSVWLWCLVTGFCAVGVGAQNVTENEIGGAEDARNVTENEIRPYEFTFNIVDFQHRSERKDDDGLITGEYGFITADGIYHETAYATDKTGDFIITKMRHRKITSLKDAEEIFKDKPEQAKLLAEALVKSCASCEIDVPELDRQETSSFVKAETTTVTPKSIEVRADKKLDLAMKEMMKVLNKKIDDTQTDNTEDEFSRKSRLSNRSGKEQLSPSISGTTASTTSEIIRDMVDAAKKVFASDDGAAENERDEPVASSEALEKMASDLFYRFNYTITSHGHWEDGFRDGRKDGEFNAKFKDGIDTHVKYVSNEFGFQPNITLVPRQEEEEEVAVADERSDDAENKTTSERAPYRGHYFNWFKK